MPSDLSTLTLNLEADADERECIDLARKLRKELSGLPDIETLDSPLLSVDPRNKASGVDWQTVVVTLAASGGVLTTLIGTVQAWLTRHERSSVTLEMGGDKLAITGVSPESQRRLVDDWITRHKR
jgi:hypothetical protein